MTNNHTRHHNRYQSYLRELRKQQALKLIQDQPMTCQQVADLMGISLGTVRAMFFEMKDHVAYEYISTTAAPVRIYHAIAEEYPVEVVEPTVKEELPVLPAHIYRPNMEKIMAKYKDWNPDTGTRKERNAVSGSTLSMVI